MNGRTAALAGALTLVFLMTPCWAQNRERQASQHFGRGAHFFNQGRYSEAVREFDLASGLAPYDARIYFLRGISKHRMGWQYDAEADFQMGAQVEVQQRRRDVGMALQRLQGGDRLVIERYRRDAKKLAAELAQQTPRDVNAAEKPRQPAETAEPAGNPPPRAASKRPAVAYKIDNLQPDESDPFTEGAVGFLGRGELQASVVQPAAGLDEESDASSSVSADEADPVGSGVAEESTEEAFPTDDSSPPASSSAGGSSKPSAVGAAFRALMRSLPGESLRRQGERMIPPGLPLPGGAPPGMIPPGAEGQPDGMPAEEGDTPFAEPDPFVDEPAEEANDGDAAAEPADSDDSEAAEADDPFAVEEE